MCITLAVGQVVFAGLPNITGTFQQIVNVMNSAASTWVGAATGAFAASRWGAGSNSSITGGTSGDSLGDLRIDASMSCPIYGGSPTVQPRSYGVLPCVYLGS